jgi:hypothetical protein
MPGLIARKAAKPREPCLGSEDPVFHAASHGIYGAPKIHQDLIDDGIRCGKNRVARIMRKAGIAISNQEEISKQQPTPSTSCRLRRTF